MLPDIDGFTVLRRLRDGGSQVPVLFLTARDATDDRVYGLTIGGDDYLVKPFAVAELVALVRTSSCAARAVTSGAVACVARTWSSTATPIG